MSTLRLNETHEPGLRSWVDSANVPGHDFPIQNLPFGVFRRAGSTQSLRGGVAIGDYILDLGAAHDAGLFEGMAAQAALAAREPQLNALMAAGEGAWSALRLALSRALRRGSSARAALQSTLLAQPEAEYALPARIGDYTDFYSSIYHATAVGRLFRPNEPLTPNYRWLPLGYHGRCSSIAISGQEFARPCGQHLQAGQEGPALGASERLDYELELGLYIGPGNALGTRIGIDEARSQLFGVCLLNDWSARDLQAWETVPLGPFLGKSFATTISPWIVTLEALEPYRLPWRRSAQDPHRWRTWTARGCAAMAYWTSSWKPGSRPHRCAPRASQRCGSRTRAIVTPIGAARSCWHITRSTAAICGPGICSVPARSRGPHPRRPARCSSAPAAAVNHCNWLTVSGAAFSKTAIRSYCAVTASAPVRLGSAWARCSLVCCRRALESGDERARAIAAAGLSAVSALGRLQCSLQADCTRL
jgi:fumarylacetoacetase